MSDPADKKTKQIKEQTDGVTPAVVPAATIPAVFTEPAPTVQTLKKNAPKTPPGVTAGVAE